MSHHYNANSGLYQTLLKPVVSTKSKRFWNFRTESRRNLDSPEFSVPCCCPHCQHRVKPALHSSSDPWFAFSLVKKSYRQRCATATRIYVVFVLSRANYYEICCSLRVLANYANNDNRHRYNNWNTVNSNVVQVLALNSDFRG